MSEKSPKEDVESRVGVGAMKKPKPTMAMKFGFGKRKSSGDDETSPKSAKLDGKPKLVNASLGNMKPTEPVKPASKKMTVAAAFGDDSDSEPEDMPAEAKMRMRNIGRETPTAAGPNSFGKGKFGFTDNHRKHERLVEEVAKQVDG